MSNHIETLPIYACAKSRCRVQIRGVAQHLFEPRTEPAFGFPCALDDVLVELVYSRVDILAGAVELPLGLNLCILVLLPGLCAVLIKLLLGFLCLSLGLVGLVSLTIEWNMGTVKTYILLRG
jgi:hypothetical protein